METHDEAVERVIIIGRIDEHHKAREYCTEQGFKIVYDTPKLIFPFGDDPGSFKIIAEKFK